MRILKFVLSLPIAILFSGCGEHIPEVHVAPPMRGTPPPVFESSVGLGGALTFGNPYCSICWFWEDISSLEFKYGDYGNGERRYDYIDEDDSVEYYYEMEYFNGFEISNIFALGEPPLAPVIACSFGHGTGFGFSEYQAAFGIGGYISSKYIYLMTLFGIGKISGTLEANTIWNEVNCGINLGTVDISVFSGFNGIMSTEAGDYHTPQLFDTQSFGIKILLIMPVKERNM